jgi:hypothetical protein
MTYRIILFSFLTAYSISINAMDPQAQQILAQAQELMEPLKGILATVKIAAEKSQQDEVDTKSLNEYCEKTTLLKKQLLITVGQYKPYLLQKKGENTTYETCAAGLKKATHEFFTNYLSRPAHARVYLAHPESFVFSETVDRAKGIVDNVEATCAGGDIFNRLLFDDLLLSPHVNGLKKMLETAKEQSKAK